MLLSDKLLRLGVSRPTQVIPVCLEPYRAGKPRLHPRVTKTSSTSGSTAIPTTTSEPASSSGQQLQGVLQEGQNESYWSWKYGSKIRFLTAGNTGTPILLLHGFGVGAHHWERNIVELAAAGHRVFAVDLLGQGSSWPEQPVAQSERLEYSIETWTEQLRDFVVEVVLGGAIPGGPSPGPQKQKIFVAGNSLGGMLALHLAAQHPELVGGLVLLNATPFWSFRPAQGSPQGIWGLLPQDLAVVPGPVGLKRLIERFWWDNLRSPATVRSMIQLVYAEKSAADEVLVQRIVDATLQPGALDAFTSIVLSPKPAREYDEVLRMVAHMPILMLYGREDPWVVPLWGQRLKRAVPSATYLEVSPSGHCPHHESPAAVNRSIVLWMRSVEQQQGFGLGVGDSWDIEEDIAPIGSSVSSVSSLDEAGGAGKRRVRVTHVDGGPRNVFEVLDYWVWKLREGRKK